MAAGRRRRWASPGPEGIECPSTTLCVAFERTYGLVWTATNPTGGAAAWTSRTVPIQLRDLSCPTTTLCVGAGSFDEIVTSTDPTGPASAWPATASKGSTSRSASRAAHPRCAWS